MQALVYTGPNTLELRDEPTPRSEPGEALVAVEAVGICGSDMHAFHGHDPRRPPPLVLGHEAAGRIASGPRKGERVAVNPLVVDPACPFAREGRPHLSPMRQLLSMPPRPGAFAQFVRVPETNLLPVPDALPIEEAALAEPLAVAWHGVRLGAERLHGPWPAARVVVLGGGAIGLGSGLVARLFGAREVRVGETNALRRETLGRAGLDAYAPGADDEPEADSADVVIDAVGAVSSRAAASRLVRPGGVIVHLGLLPGTEGLDVRKMTLQEITVTGSYCYTPADFAQTLDALAANRFGPIGWAQSRPLAEGARAFADIDAGATPFAKIILQPAAA